MERACNFPPLTDHITAKSNGRNVEAMPPCPAPRTTPPDPLDLADEMIARDRYEKASAIALVEIARELRRWNDREEGGWELAGDGADEPVTGIDPRD